MNMEGFCWHQVAWQHVFWDQVSIVKRVGGLRKKQFRGGEDEESSQVIRSHQNSQDQVLPPVILKSCCFSHPCPCSIQGRAGERAVNCRQHLIKSPL